MFWRIYIYHRVQPMTEAYQSHVYICFERLSTDALRHGRTRYPLPILECVMESDVQEKTATVLTPELKQAYVDVIVLLFNNVLTATPD